MNQMNSTPLPHSIQSAVKKLINRWPVVHFVVSDITSYGGRVLLVGGVVRDLFFGRLSKDIDIEVHGLTQDQFEQILRSHGPVSLVGKVYGVYRLHNVDIDWSLPRADEFGRKPIVAIDPYMSITKAFERRDLTMNAMGIDIATFELIDPFGGQEDIAQKRLRAPNIRLFGEDPLRFFRVMQFVGRFEMKPDDELNQCCQKMVVTDVSLERRAAEYEKLLLLSQRPSLGFWWLSNIGRLVDILPELHALHDVEQDVTWHPEGDVFTHTMQTIDASVLLPQDDEYNRLVLRYAALCHDLGKATTTIVVDGEIKSYGHEDAGVDLTKQLLARMTNIKDLVADVCLLVKYHMAPLQFIKEGAKKSAYKRLANKLMPRMNIQLLADLARADRAGRNPESSQPLSVEIPDVDQFVSRAQQAQVQHKGEEPILLGRDLLDVVSPGPELGNLLNAAYEIQIEEGVTDKQELRRRVLAQYRS